jgi:predicted ATPase/class 3 adenylate cyclase/DNA-binding CsgD family transcriptional regulator
VHQLPRGTLTLLFTDIEGSSRLLRQVGDRYAEALAECRRLLRQMFHEYGGHEVDTQADAFFVAFARATDAVGAAVAAQRAVAQYSWPEGVVLRVRMGMHTGEPEQFTEGYVGLDVHYAARIMSAGHGGQVLLSQTTRELVALALPEGVRLADLGTHHLKDLQQPSHLFQLVIAGLPADFPPLKTLDASPNNLPVQPTPLIGREQEVAAVAALLNREEVRLLTLTGPGGMGKTRLGLQVAAELSEAFTDGVFFVNLAPIRDPALVLPAIAQALEVKEMGAHSPLDLLNASLREKHLLLLLDNFEQVVQAAPQVAALLVACPKLKIVVTSRMALHVRAEQEFAVPPLALPDPERLLGPVALAQYEAVALFIIRAQAVKPDFQVTNATAPAVAEICVRLDGLPLALELAAARIKLFPPHALLARLSHRLAVLTGGARDAPLRQQTLCNTLAWSYDLLDAQEQQLFRRLSVFAGGCSLEAVEAVYLALGNEPGQVVEAVASLIDKSLLQQREQEGGVSRFTMLETIREYGLETLATSEEGEAVRQAHARYHLQLAMEVNSHLSGADEQGWGWYARLEQDHENLQAALHWLLERKEAELALRLCSALWLFWLIQGHLSEGCAFLEQTLAASAEVAKAERAEALNGLGLLLVNKGDNEQAERRLEESLALYRELGDTVNTGWPLHNLGLATMSRGEYTRARLLLEESLALFSEIGARDGRAFSLCHLAQVYSEQGEYMKARASAEESLALFRELEDTVGICEALLILARVLFDPQGNTAASEALMNECLTLASKVGDEARMADANHLAAEVALSQGDSDRTRSLIEKSLAFYREKGYQQDSASALVILGQVATVEGDYATAQACYEESLLIARGIGDQRVIPSGLEGVAAVVAPQGALVWAARLWGAADILRETIGKPLPPRERARYELAVTDTRTLLGEKDFAAAWAQGRTMTPAQALATQGQAMTPAVSLAIQHARSPLTYPDGLTAREVEVLRLLAQGLTNARIAEHLVISPRTVNTHLTSIYNKIGTSSRSSATRYTLEHHLL